MTDKAVKVTLIKSMAGQLSAIRNSARGLGLRRIGHSVVVADTPSNRGMMNAASHMLTIERAADSKPAAAKRPAAAPLPLLEHAGTREIFADEVSGVFAPNNNLHLTFACYRADHSQAPAPIARVVTSRLVLPLSAARDLERLLGDLQKSLRAQATAFQIQGTPTLQ